jgi:glycosyltransferase involved in cell wall biosynthesis
MGRPDLLWSVLVPTLSSRQAKFLDLMGVLLPQCEADGRVEVVGLHNDGERTIAEYRQALLEDARGEYLSFFDDDDGPEPDFVPAVTEAMEGRPDFVAFRVAYYENGVLESRPTVTGLQHDRWHDTDTAMIRDITHINPVRSVLAKRADFRVQFGDGKEDWSYRSALRPLLETQAEIDRILYHYRHDTGDSVQFKLRPHAHAPRPVIDSPAFRWHPWSTG